MEDMPRFLDHVLAVLRHYGWDMGVRRLRDECAAEADPERKRILQGFIGWLAAETGAIEEAERFLAYLDQSPDLKAWKLAGDAFLAMRVPDLDRAHALLEQASALALPIDHVLIGTLEHLKGAVQFHAGKSDLALGHLRRALERLGRDHFGTGRVLDTFGMVYASLDNFHAAEEFYRQALVCKQQWDDQLGLALTHGNLGRLYLDWGYLDKARDAFLTDLTLAQKINDARGEAQMHDHLGQVDIHRAERALANGRDAEASKALTDAVDLLGHSLRAAVENGWAVTEAFARKDLAHAALAKGDLETATEQLDKSHALFEGLRFKEGLAHVDRLRGILLGRRGAFRDAHYFLREAWSAFERCRETAEMARTEWAIARVRRAEKAPATTIANDYKTALDRAELSRRAELVRRIGEELHEINAEEYHAHMFRRVRGRGVSEPTDSLIEGTSEYISALFLDVKDSTINAREAPAEVVLMSLNQMMAHMVDVLRRHAAQISGFRGDGFLALFRGQRNAERAVTAALELIETVEEFNQPRRILDRPELKPYEVRIGIATGPAVMGNMGTYDMMDFTAIGTTVNLGARLEAAAMVGHPCICATTHSEVRDRFCYHPKSPRKENLKNLGEHEVHDVVGRAPARAGRV